MNQAVLTNPSMTCSGNELQSLGRRIWDALELIGANRAVAELRRQGLPLPRSFKLSSPSISRK